MGSTRRGRQLPCIVCAAVAAVACWAWAPTTAKAQATPDGFFGVIPSGITSYSEYQRMGRGGAEVIRTFLNRRLVEQSPGARDWRSIDVSVKLAALNGMTVLPALFGTPSFVGTKPARLPVFTPAQRQGWYSFVADAARRFGVNGEYWAANPTLPYKPITEWQLWNEPNINGFVAGRANPRHYARLIRITDAALASADPAARLGLGGLFRRPADGTGAPMKDYLNSLYEVRGIKSHFEAVSVHPYAKKPRDVLGTMKIARRVMRSHRDAGSEMWVTEVGWTTGGREFKKSPFKSSSATQARYLRQTYGLLIKARAGLNLTTLVWHSWRDRAGTPDLWNQYMGLFDAGGTPKPSWFEYARIAGGTP